MSALSPIRAQPLFDRFAAARADLPQPSIERAADDAVQPLGEGDGSERAGDRRTGERTTALDQLRRAFGTPRADRGDVVQISTAARDAAVDAPADAPAGPAVDRPEATDEAGAADGTEAAATDDPAAPTDDPERAADANAPKKPTGEPLTEADLRLIEKLEARDREVRAHEQAHKAVGGRYAGAISYDYQRGPDGDQYAVGGEVSIDIAEVPGDPAATIRKMQIVRRAALAPAEPSGADRAAAAKASQRAAEAQGELRAQQVEEAKQAREEAAEAGEEAAEGRADAADEARPADEPTESAAPSTPTGGVDGRAIRRVSGQAGFFVGRRSGGAIGGDAIGGDAIGGDAIGGDAIGGDAIEPSRANDAIDAITPDISAPPADAGRVALRVAE